jgi:hypothetical protein
MAAIPVRALRPAKSGDTVPLSGRQLLAIESTSLVPVVATATSRATGRSESLRVEPAATNLADEPVRYTLPLWFEMADDGGFVLADLSYETGNGEKVKDLAVGLIEA